MYHTRSTILNLSRNARLLAAVMLVCLMAPFSLSAQNPPQKTRILFVLDASGSMAGKWEGRTKYEIARELLFQSIDSIQRENPDIEIGLRIFGHQSPKDFKDCKDSRLEIGFGNKNAAEIKALLDKIKIQGQTPIAYSLFEAANDFPVDKNAKNAIVLITDGLETCDGDPCAVAEVLQKRRIVLKPFVIGLGIEEEGKGYFDCVGTYYDATNKSTFRNTLDVVISQAVNNTTAQINLLDIYGQPSETNVELTFYDAYSNEAVYNFVHSLDFFKRPDTIYINPAGKYRMVAHTVPEVVVDNIELTPGKHNIIAANTPQGDLVLKIDKAYSFSQVPAIVRKHQADGTLVVQTMNTRKKLLVGAYDVEVLTLPRVFFENVKVDQGKDTELVVEAAGKLHLTVGRQGIASIYISENGGLERIYEFKNISGSETLELQPGEYTVVYRPSEFNSAELTRASPFTIKSKSTAYVKF